MVEQSSGSPLDDFNELEKDTIKEIANISLGSSATALSLLTSRRVNITTPSISYKTVQEINASYKTPCILIEVKYIEGIKGSNLLIMDTRDAVVISQLMMETELNPSEEISELHLSAVSEAMNQMMGASATAMSDIFNKLIHISAPRVENKLVKEAINQNSVLSGYSGFIQIAFRIEVEDLIDSELLQLMPLEFTREMVDYLIGMISDEPLAAKKQRDLGPLPVDEQPYLGAAVDTADTGSAMYVAVDQTMVCTPKVEDDEFNLVKNILLDVKGVVGRVRMTLSQVLQLDKGSVVEFDFEAGEHIEILINGKRISNAEIVAVGNQYGLKLTKIHKSREDR